MPGKLNLDLGDDYKFWPKRAKEVAENTSNGGGGGGNSVPFVDGPNSSNYGADYWLQRDANQNWFWWVNIDTDPGPDIKRPLPEFLADQAITQAYRNDVRARAQELGYNG